MPDPRARPLATALSLGLPLAALVAVQALSPAAQRLPAGPARFDLAAAWLALEPGALAGTPWTTAPSMLGRIQLGLLLHAAQALQGGAVLSAAMLVTPVLAAVQALLLWLLLRRLGCGTVAAGLATAVVGIAPAAVVAHAAVSTAGIAVGWLLSAALLALRGGRIPMALAGAAAVLAAASFPVAAVPVVIGAVVLRDRRLALGAGPALAAVVVLAVVLGALPASEAGRQLAAVGAAQPLLTTGAASPVAWAVTDPLGLLVAVVALVVAAGRPAGRPLVVAAALLLAASVWPAGADPAGPLVLLLALAALATGLVAQRAAVALIDPVFRRSLIGSGWLTGVGALLITGVVVALLGLPQLVPRSDRPLARVEAWLAGSVPDGRLVLVGLGTWPDLGGEAGERVGWYAGGAGADPSSSPWTAADYVVTDASLDAASGSAAAVLDRSAAVAGFGRGADRLTVRAVRGGGTASSTPSTSPTPTPTPTAPSDAAERRSADERLDAGRQLAENPRIELSGDDRALLEDGEVDARVALVLAQLATAHRITVASFGVQRGDASGIRTTVLISAVDGHRVPADVTRTGELLRFLSALRDDFAARSIDATTSGVIASFTPDPTWVPSS